VAEVKEPTVSPVWAAPRPAWLEKNSPMHDAACGPSAKAGEWNNDTVAVDIPKRRAKRKYLRVTVDLLAVPNSNQGV